MRKFVTTLLGPKSLYKPSLTIPHPLRRFSSIPDKPDENSPEDTTETTPLGFTENDTKEPFVTQDFMEDFEDANFVDRYKVKVFAGKGGNGSFTFYRDRIQRTGAPDGGDGGDGGSFHFRALTNFKDFAFMKKPEMHGNDGKNGRRSKQNGKEGSPIYYPVPVGTLVWELKTVDKRLDRETRQKMSAESRDLRYKAVKKRLLADLDVAGKSVLVAQGGKGGRGNGYHRGMMYAEKGKSGEEVNIMLELKCLADIGLVGYPNAGKSTVLATLTRAFPKIASYPFTTLQPLVGKIEFIDEFEMTMADIPGLIEGSHENKGLGHDFLRHIERTKLLMFVMDITEKDLVYEFNTLKRELELYGDNIFKGKPFLVVLNKVDLITDSEEVIKDLSEKLGCEVIGISAKYSIGLDKVVVKLREIVEEFRRKQEEEIKRMQEEERLRHKPENIIG